MRIIPVILLFLPLAAFAGCFVHPDTGVTYCTSSSGCPVGTEWNPSTQACNVPKPGLAASCTGSDSGTYNPVPLHIQNVAFSTGHRAMWIRVNEVVTVAGAVSLIPNGVGVTQVYIPLPVQTILRDHYDLAGTMAGLDGTPSTVIADPLGSWARLFYTADVALRNANLRYTFTYVISECLQ